MFLELNIEIKRDFSQKIFLCRPENKDLYSIFHYDYFLSYKNQSSHWIEIDVNLSKFSTNDRLIIFTGMISKQRKSSHNFLFYLFVTLLVFLYYQSKLRYDNRALYSYRY